MNVMRALVFLLLSLMVMPWGAYAAHPARAGASVVQTGAASDVAVLDLADSAPTQLTLQRRCHGPLLPGSPCQPDLGLLPSARPAPTDVGGRSVRLLRVVHLRGICPSAALDPPRQG